MTEDQDLAAVQEEFGPYLVYERLGVGGMATVHRARERGIEDFERIVALKRLLPHLAEDASFIKSFVREAKLASMLQHANIVQILELGRVGPTYFISMEYIDGRDIRKILRHARKVSGPPPINVTIALILQLCDALDYAHNRTDSDGHALGLVHRDLSPSNLLLTQSGHLKVIDFGIAKAQSAQLRTQTGRVKGKLAYMAPEAIAGKELDSRSDLFSAGVVFHELLTARPLFAQKNEYQTLLKVQRGEVGPPSAFNEGVPKELDDIVLKALARDPEDRWPNAASLRDALVTVRMARQLSATPRDVVNWIDWAFGLEPPNAGFSGRTGTDFGSGMVSGGNSFGGTASPLARHTPRPRTPVGAAGEEEAAAEIAWGAPEHESGVIHLHDEVPDVSGKVAPLAAAGADFGAGEPATDEHPAFDPGLMEAGQSGGELSASSTIRTLAVPPPGSPSQVRPAAFPAGSSDDALLKARRPRGSSRQPVARARTSSMQPAQRQTGQNPILPPPPGRGSTNNILGDFSDPGPSVDDIPVAPTRIKAPSMGPNIGAAIAARETHNLRTAIIALAVLGLTATAITLAVTIGDDEVEPQVAPPPATPVRTTGTVKFSVKPADATIKIAGSEDHAGSPWQTELAAGHYQVEIHRDGFKTYLTSVELMAGETQTQVVVLEQVAAATGTAATATLIVDPSMPGLEVVLDGTVLDQRTPLRMEVPPGPHTVALRQDGSEAWSEDFTAVANATHAFDPSMSDDKKRERRRRRDKAKSPFLDEHGGKGRNLAPAPGPAPAPAPAAKPLVPVNPFPPGSTPPAPGAKPDPVKPDPRIATPAPATTPPPVAVTPTPITPPPPPPPRLTGPELIPPSAVSRVSGSMPQIRSRDGSSLPSGISAKVCIGPSGSVTSAHVLPGARAPDDVKRKLEDAIRDWRYSSYKKDGVAVAACFVASFRLK